MRNDRLTAQPEPEFNGHPFRHGDQSAMLWSAQTGNMNDIRQMRNSVDGSRESQLRAGGVHGWTVALWNCVQRLKTYLYDVLFGPRGRRSQDPLNQAKRSTEDVYGLTSVLPSSRSSQQLIHGAGWYHVHRSELTCRLCSKVANVFLPHPSAPTFHALVSRLPPEIIHEIVRMLDEVVNDKSLVHRRQTGPALVCRHWADVCLRGPREWFDRVHGREQIMALRMLASAPESYLKSTIIRFGAMWYDLEMKDDPWLHLLPGTRRLLLNYDNEDEVTVYGPIGRGLKTMRSIHAYLPKSMPWRAGSRGIKTLSLYDIEFRSFNDLLHLLDELRCLSRFTGRRLSWPESTPIITEYSYRRPRAEHLSRRTVQLQDCTSNLEAIALGNYIRNRAWISSLRAVCKSLLNGEREPKVTMDWQSAYNTRQDLDGPVKDAYRILKLNMTIDPSDSGRQFGLFISLPSLTQPELYPPYFCPARLVFWFSQSPRKASSIDWKAFNEAVMANLQVHSMALGHRPEYPGWAKVLEFGEHHWRPFTDDDKRFVEGSLPTLFDSGRLLFPTSVSDQD